MSDLAPFITVADLSDTLGIDVSADDGAVIAIDAACDMCRAVAEQPFTAGTTTVTLDGNGTDALLLPYLPVTAAGTVTLASGTITEYMFTDNGYLLRGTAGALPRPTWPDGRQNVRVTFHHGYTAANFPRDVKMVALAAAKRIVVQGAAMEESLGDNRVKYAAASTDLTDGEKLILGKYRQIR